MLHKSYTLVLVSYLCEFSVWIYLRLIFDRLAHWKSPNNCWKYEALITGPYKQLYTKTSEEKVVKEACEVFAWRFISAGFKAIGKECCFYMRSMKGEVWKKRWQGSFSCTECFSCPMMSCLWSLLSIVRWYENMWSLYHSVYMITEYYVITAVAARADQTAVAISRVVVSEI